MKISGLSGAAALVSACSKPTAQPSAAIKDVTDDVKGVVFMVSDGMSSGVLTMAENFSNIVYGKGSAWWKLIGNPESTSGLMETSSADSYVTDSAAAASAWGGGVKINNGIINVRPDGTESTPIMRHLKQLGHRTGLVSTSTITHATPAGFAAVSWNRNDEHLIATQYAGIVDVILGGGMKFFDKNQRDDSRDVLALYEKSGYQLIRDRDALLGSESEQILGLFSDDHIPYEVDRHNSEPLTKLTPSLAEMTEVAMKRMLGGNEKFLLQIEAARVDHAAHANDIAGLLWDQLAFDDALAKVMEMTAGRDDILVIVTSDHGNANPGLNGTGPKYANSNEAFNKIIPIKASHESLIREWGTSKENTSQDLAALIHEKIGFSLTTKETEALYASLTEGGARQWSKQLNNPHGILGQIVGNHTGIGWTGTSHTSDPTMISAIGPQAERFSGIVPNQEVHRHFLELLG